jgi:hypothetical protein
MNNQDDNSPKGNSSLDHKNDINKSKINQYYSTDNMDNNNKIFNHKMQMASSQDIQNLVGNLPYGAS